MEISVLLLPSAQGVRRRKERAAPETATAAAAESLTVIFPSKTNISGTIRKTGGGSGAPVSASRIAFFSYSLRAAPSCLFGQLLEGPEAQGPGRTGCHTGRLLSLGNEIHAQVALLHLSIGAELGYTEGTRHEAEMTAEALFLVDHHDAIFGSLPDGTLWTCRHAGRVSAVQTRKGNGSACDHWERTAPDPYDPSPLHAPFDVMQGLAGHLTGMALDASPRIEIEAVLLHHRRYLTYSLRGAPGVRSNGSLLGRLTLF